MKCLYEMVNMNSRDEPIKFKSQIYEFGTEEKSLRKVLNENLKFRVLERRRKLLKY